MYELLSKTNKTVKQLLSCACGFLMCVTLSVCVVLLCVRVVLTKLMSYLDAGLLARPATSAQVFLGFPVSNIKC
jgi:hypothetical protein